jgi:hypothetical protein
MTRDTDILNAVMADERVALRFVSLLHDAFMMTRATGNEEDAWYQQDDDSALADMMSDFHTHYMADGVTDTEDDMAQVRRAIYATLISWSHDVAETGAFSHDA